MKRKSVTDLAIRSSKRQALAVAEPEEFEPYHDDNPDPGQTVEEVGDDNESMYSESGNTSASNEPPAQTAPTSVAASTTSRAGRKFPSDLKTIPCPEPGCGKTFNRPARLTAHLRSHSNDRPFKCREPGCDKSYLEEKHLRQHTKGSHSQERKYTCEEPGCNKAFLTGTRLRRHAAVHEGAERFRCTGYDGCSQSFRKHQTLQRHIRTAHLGQKAYTCTTDSCTDAFDTPNALKRHVEREHGELKFWCDECGEADPDEQRKVGFTTLHLLQAHVREMHLACPFCDVKCFGPSEVEKHVDNFHSGKTVEDRKTVACTWEGCPKTFVKVANLNAHIKSAHEGFRLVCGQVDTFQWSADVADWNWMEEGCGDTFVSKAKLEEHIRYMHLGKTRPTTLYPDPTASGDAVRDLAGLDDLSKRNLFCSVEGCEARFIRYHDLGLHMQREHNDGYGDQNMAASAQSQGGVSGTPATALPVDPELALLQEFVNLEPEAPSDVFWFAANSPNPQREDQFEHDMVAMRSMIDMDALMADGQSTN